MLAQKIARLRKSACVAKIPIVKSIQLPKKVCKVAILIDVYRTWILGEYDKWVCKWVGKYKNMKIHRSLKWPERNF